MISAVFGVGFFEVILIALILVLLYKLCLQRLFEKFILRRRRSTSSDGHFFEGIQKLPPLKRQDMTIDQLLQFDGSNDERRICLAVDGKIFDVSSARHLYGKDSSYGIFAGHDASRGLATFSTTPAVIRDTHDDLLDLKSSEVESMREWATQFKEKYPVVGRLLKPGEQSDVYTDEDENYSLTTSSSTASADAAPQRNKKVT